MTAPKLDDDGVLCVVNGDTVHPLSDTMFETVEGDERTETICSRLRFDPSLEDVEVMRFTVDEIKRRAFRRDGEFVGELCKGCWRRMTLPE